jgi:maleate isomerase
VSELKEINSKSVDVVYDVGSHWRARIGYVLLAMEQTIQNDVYQLTPPGVGSFFTRVTMPNAVTVKNLMAVADDLPRAASLILPELTLDAITYACTSGSLVIGEERVKELLNQGAPGAKASSLVTGAIRALHALDAKKVVLATPYLDEINTLEYDYFNKRGLEVLDIQGLNITNDEDIARVSPKFMRDFARSVDRPDADAVFISCGALRVLDIIEDLEQALGKPVVTSNQALIWDALRLAGIDDKLDQYGTLFRNY